MPFMQNSLYKEADVDSIKKDALFSSEDMTFYHRSSEKNRLDDFLSKELKTSKNQILQAIKNNLISINDKIAKKGGIILKQDDCIKVKLKDSSTINAESKSAESSAESAQFAESMESSKIDFDVEILYEDDDILILNKPPFLVVHKAPSVKEPTLVDWLESKNFTLSTLSGEDRTGIVHRLDKETSGAIAIAKNNTSHSNLSAQLQTKQMGRYYLAIIDSPLAESRIISCNLARHPKNRLKMTNADSLRTKIPNARFAKSHFVPLLESKDANLQLIAIKLYTGRTHQIRAHLESISRHIIGDKLYGYKGKENVRVMLHSYLLHLTHPLTQKDMMFCAPMFADMLQFCFLHFDQREFNEAIKKDNVLQCFI